MDDVVVARIGKPHGLKGEVTVQVHTDSPAERFVKGAVFATDPASTGPLTLRTARLHNGIQLLAFDEAPDRTAAEALRGTRLLAQPDAEDDDDDAWYEDDLIGLAVVDTHGGAVGEVVALHPRPVQDLLEISKTGGGTAYVPFVEEIVPEVDVDAGRVVIDPPPGLLNLDD
ncbi:ribosome maturation factor RimM [Luteipulveratus halotolerans]|uniref:Ribosome maturation factor RimM n=1 Tax=Luteipulveratus halotolerans TaxID=1631356 RepID=A0A0L6CJA3_9MICO|nr:ribosome maturation factor RimM [Luteipulveratus halotolerans]KNX37583.1 ribosome maturation factor RimM [Luteipulveratus halotolerans]